MRFTSSAKRYHETTKHTHFWWNEKDDDERYRWEMRVDYESAYLKLSGRLGSGVGVILEKKSWAMGKQKFIKMLPATLFWIFENVEREEQNGE